MAVRLDEMTYVELHKRIAAKQDTLVWAVGTLEAHGKHLPLGTDTYLAQGIAERIADAIGAILAPELHYGITGSLLPYPGGTTIDPRSYAGLIRGALEGFFAAGFRKVIISNGHGGNTDVLQKTVRRLTPKYPDRLMITFDWYMLDGEFVKDVYGGTAGHAGLDETAGIIYFRPELVKEEYFDADDWHLREAGYLATPAPAPVIVNDANSAPQLDPDKAKELFERIINLLISRVSRDIALWESNLGRGVR